MTPSLSPEELGGQRVEVGEISSTISGFLLLLCLGRWVLDARRLLGFVALHAAAAAV